MSKGNANIEMKNLGDKESQLNLKDADQVDKSKQQNQVQSL